MVSGSFKFSRKAQEIFSNFAVTALKKVQPAIQVLAYFDIAITAKSLSARYSEDMYLHDPITRDRLVAFSSYYLMDPASSAWRKYAIQTIQGYLSHGFDGIHLDDVWSDIVIHTKAQPEHSAPYAAVPPWYHQSQYQAGVYGMLAAVKQAIAPKLLIFNGLDEFPNFGTSAYLPAADGAIQEGFVFDQRYGKDFVTGNSWRELMQVYLAIPRTKSLHIISYGDPADVEARLYALSSYLLGAYEHSTFYYTPACDIFAYLPEWTISLGDPLTSPSNLAALYDPTYHVYRRAFARGLVLVNPGNTPTSPIKLPATYKMLVPSGGLMQELGGDGQLHYTTTQTMTLQAHQGAILLSASS